MKKRIAWGLACLLLLSCLWSGRAETLSEAQLISYYDGAVFVGDSITEQLRIYLREQQEEKPGYFSHVRFFTAQSYMLYIASRKILVTDAANLKYGGMELPLWEILADIKPPKVLILLGVNDYIGEKIEKGVGYCERIVDLVAESTPNTQVIFFSLTPVTQNFCRKRDYRTMWDEYNAALKAMCDRRGALYIDIATGLKDAEGYLRMDYSTDGYYHLNSKGLQVWVAALLDFAQAQYDLGRWTPEGF